MQTKSDIWNYEQEVRSMKFMQGAHAFKKEALVEIAFGLNCKNNDVSLIKKIVSDNEYLVVQFSQAHKLKKEFGLKIVRC